MKVDTVDRRGNNLSPFLYNLVINWEVLHMYIKRIDRSRLSHLRVTQSHSVCAYLFDSTGEKSRITAIKSKFCHFNQKQRRKSEFHVSAMICICPLCKYMVDTQDIYTAADAELAVFSLKNWAYSSSRGGFFIILFFFFIVGRHQESLHRKQAVTKGQRRENRCCIDRRDWFTRSGSAWSEKKKKNSCVSDELISKYYTQRLVYRKMFLCYFRYFV